MTNRSEYAPVECVNIPKMLFQEKQYEKLSVDAKLLYSLLLDRKTMANMNGWIDQNGTAYVVYPKSEMKKHLNASRYRVDMALEELEKCGQMVVVTQPDPGKPCQIYVKDITGNHENDMEENTMCMMMKDSNDKNKEPMVEPCMGIPGMHGVAIFFDPEEFMKAFADEEKETDAKMETDDSEAYSEEDEADEENIEYDYRDEAYYAIPRKEQKMIDMAFYGYIDENEVPNEQRIIEDSAYLGKEIGEWLSHLAMSHGVDAEGLMSYIHDLYTSGKRNQIRSIMTAIALLCGDLDEYVDAMECCVGLPKKLFLNGVCYASAKVVMALIGDEEQE